MIRNGAIELTAKMLLNLLFSKIKCTTNLVELLFPCEQPRRHSVIVKMMLFLLYTVIVAAHALGGKGNDWKNVTKDGKSTEVYKNRNHPGVHVTHFTKMWIPMLPSTKARRLKDSRRHTSERYALYITAHAIEVQSCHEYM